MIESVEARVMLSRNDLLANALLIDRRESDPDAELERLVKVRRFIAASFELTRTLRAQTQAALVNHCGTAGTRSLGEATEVMFSALAEYALRCRELATAARASGVESDDSQWQPQQALACGGSAR